MRNIIYFCILIVLLLSGLAGCNQDGSKQASSKEATDQMAHQKQNKENKSKQKDSGNNTPAITPVKSLPKTYEELASLKAGEYANIVPKLNESDKIVKTFSNLPDITGERSKNKLDQFYNELLSMVQQNYIGPEEAINRLKFAAIGSPDMEDPRYQFKDQLNVEIILDASGSMAQIIKGTSKMDAAKSTITNFVQSLPKDANVGIRVYGNKGSNADSDKQISCSSSDIAYPISSYESNQFEAALGKIKPTGWTPTALALNQAKKDLSNFDGSNNTNIVYLVSDGISTCDDDPMKAAKELYDSNIAPIINVIGFDVDSQGENQLQQIADTTQGIYQTVSDESELQKELQNINDLAERWEKWKKKSTEEIDLKHTQNSLDIFGYITDEGAKETNERTVMEIIMHILKEDGKMNRESYDYLLDKNQKYHKWIDSEIESFNEQLKSLNDKNYAEAIKELQEKYQNNKQ